ncbi:methylmalonyl Co-A mutase-associated GTPase MeaB [Epilithonimonas pallida]|uniref:Methylmalonyl-CoA mutase metallochaperone MeaB n=1 Tax=Epilithonimonas pallida TaxID=373671 RepID=A0ABY1QZR0_9FLAO|nr:methylmalonyl Co-A mutase-associated GTPase MeaB [Epilithonimonas pallida]SMP90296.1 methylmalonyl-CoA mutase metallochaperone MeaB [Epilithonimonas pallida]
MNKSISLQDYINGIKSSDKRILGKAITLIESKKPEHREIADQLLKEILPFTGKSVRVGITGVPGAGKSTFIESFGKYAIKQGKKVAVLAIDPSSSINKGSILGDKTRMEELAKDPNAFIRPSPSSGFLGGIANTTFESLLICEAAGFDYILIETVGVGQSETLVNDITDVFLFLKVIGTGDELQGIKRGIMEMADLIFINKVNSENLSKAKMTKTELTRALQFITPKEKDWKIPVILGSALEKTGLDEIYNKIENYITLKTKNGTFFETRKKQAQKRFEFWVREYILEKAKNDLLLANSFQEHKKNASELLSNPSSEASEFVKKLFGN